VAANREKDRH
jgi:hypothetical protein